MKAVLISIQPKWCELITQFKKLVEVRKTKPKLDVPFKCYIYCTKDKHGWFDFLRKERLDGKVIGEFVCEKIDRMAHCGTCNSDIRLRIVDEKFYTKELSNEYLEKCKLSYFSIDSYSNGSDVYGWHISNLVIYDKPKELSDFITICPEWEKEYFDTKCLGCKYYFFNCADMLHECTVEGEKPLTRPPQSWCYVEGKEDEGK